MQADSCTYADILRDIEKSRVYHKQINGEEEVHVREMEQFLRPAQPRHSKIKTTALSILAHGLDRSGALDLQKAVIESDGKTISWFVNAHKQAKMKIDINRSSAFFTRPGGNGLSEMLSSAGVGDLDFRIGGFITPSSLFWILNSEINTGHTFIIFVDACYSGAFVDYFSTALITEALSTNKITILIQTSCQSSEECEYMMLVEPLKLLQTLDDDDLNRICMRNQTSDLLFLQHPCFWTNDNDLNLSALKSGLVKKDGLTLFANFALYEQVLILCIRNNPILRFEVDVTMNGENDYRYLEFTRNVETTSKLLANFDSHLFSFYQLKTIVNKMIGVFAFQDGSNSYMLHLCPDDCKFYFYGYPKDKTFKKIWSRCFDKLKSIKVDYTNPNSWKMDKPIYFN